MVRVKLKNRWRCLTFTWRLAVGLPLSPSLLAASFREQQYKSKWPITNFPSQWALMIALISSSHSRRDISPPRNLIHYIYLLLFWQVTHGHFWCKFLLVWSRCLHVLQAKQVTREHQLNSRQKNADTGLCLLTDTQCQMFTWTPSLGVTFWTIFE